MKEETKRNAEAVVLALIERFETVEEETGANFLYAKRVIMKWSKDKKLFNQLN